VKISAPRPEPSTWGGIQPFSKWPSLANRSC